MIYQHSIEVYLCFVKLTGRAPRFEVLLKQCRSGYHPHPQEERLASILLRSRKGKEEERVENEEHEEE